MELKFSTFRLILGIVFFFIMYVAYTFINNKDAIHGFIGITLIPTAIMGLLWLDRIFPPKK